MHSTPLAIMHDQADAESKYRAATKKLFTAIQNDAVYHEPMAEEYIGIASWSEDFSSTTNSELRLLAIEYRTVQLKPLDKQIKTVQQRWFESESTYITPLSAKHEGPMKQHELESSGHRLALLSPYYSNFLMGLYTSRATERYVREQCANTSRNEKTLSLSEKALVKRNLTYTSDAALMDNVSHWVQFERKGAHPMSGLHAVSNELYHRGIQQPVHCVHVQYLIPRIEGLTVLDPLLLIRIIRPLDLTMLLGFTSIDGDAFYSPPGRMNIVGLMFLIQAINSGSDVAVAWALRDDLAQIDLPPLHLAIAFYHARELDNYKALDRIQRLWEFRCSALSKNERFLRMPQSADDKALTYVSNAIECGEHELISFYSQNFRYVQLLHRAWGT